METLVNLFSSQWQVEILTIEWTLRLLMTFAIIYTNCTHRRFLDYNNSKKSRLRISINRHLRLKLTRCPNKYCNKNTWGNSQTYSTLYRITVDKYLRRQCKLVNYQQNCSRYSCHYLRNWINSTRPLTEKNLSIRQWGW